MANPTARVRDLAEPLADRAGVELLDVEVKGGGKHRLVRLTVDRAGGVDLETCQRLSQQLSAALDEADPVPGGYRLEVTSPGTDRPLTDERAFARVTGRDVLVHRDLGDGRVVQLEGTVTAAEPTGVVVEHDDERTLVPYAEIVTARQLLPW